MYPILLRIGPITLHTYGLMVALGFLVAYFEARQEFESRFISLAVLEQLVFWLMMGGLFGARLFYFGLEAFSSFKNDPLSFFRIWEGGLVFYGGFIVGSVALLLFSRIKKISFLTLSDSLTPPLLIGQAFGRLGCFAAGCCYGKPTDFFCKVMFKHPESLAPTYVYLHPTQLYSSAGDLVLFGGAYFLSRMSVKQGILSSYYLIGYGAFRFLIEFFRDDDRGPVFLQLFPSQWIAVVAILTGIGVLFYAKNARES